MVYMLSPTFKIYVLQQTVHWGNLHDKGVLVVHHVVMTRGSLRSHVSFHAIYTLGCDALGELCLVFTLRSHRSYYSDCPQEGLHCDYIAEEILDLDAWEGPNIVFKSKNSHHRLLHSQSYSSTLVASDASAATLYFGFQKRFPSPRRLLHSLVRNLDSPDLRDEVTNSF
ncbi:hypothetical protein Sjap_015390 [Stephania japonica]|uniref:Uncharacterized protein n=1 Tax=Stephania japonica TaxID=461633 RepID=A0AAP0IJ60_9MAGN